MSGIKTTKETEENIKNNIVSIKVVVFIVVFYLSVSNKATTFVQLS